MTTWVVGVLNLLGLARQKSARFLQASTSEVYGDPEVHPQPESYPGNLNPIGPRAGCDEDKRAAETLIFDFHRVYGLDVKVARIFNTRVPKWSARKAGATMRHCCSRLLGDACPEP
jgi:UDP-glucuronate decarboxylase